MDVAGRFGDNLVRTRRLAGLSQDELSVRASVHRTEISQLERGLRLARVDTIVKLCGSLEADPAELLAGIELGAGRKPNRPFQETKIKQPIRCLAKEPNKASTNSKEPMRSQAEEEAKEASKSPPKEPNPQPDTLRTLRIRA